MGLTKDEAIRNSIRETKERRKYQKCKVYQLKFQNLKKSDVENWNDYSPKRNGYTTTSSLILRIV